MFAILAASLTSVGAVRMMRHDVAWWDERRVLIAVAVSGIGILWLLFQHATTIARQAAEIDEQWSRLFLALLRSHPGALDMAALHERAAARLAGNAGAL